jgi:hypothetical protein
MVEQLFLVTINGNEAIDFRVRHGSKKRMIRVQAKWHKN